jgi:GT2 family glycosyltransferase
MTVCIIPTYMRSSRDCSTTRDTISSLRMTAPQAEIIVVDDGSPYGVEQLEEWRDEAGFMLVALPDNAGFARTVNVGLRMALEAEHDAVLVNADVEFFEPWLENLLAAEGDIVGALLLYPNGLIQHAGVYYSILTRQFDHRYRYAPGNLKQAQEEVDCPVTAALQLIRLHVLEKVGLYDEEFRLSYEDMDYCHRVFEAGYICHYTPQVRAYHLESLFRGQKSEQIEMWERESWALLNQKWQGSNFSRYAPNMLIDHELV